MSDPRDVVTRFDEAVAAGDEPAARAVSVRWDADGDSPGKLWRQASKKRFRLAAGRAVEEGERAVVVTTLLVMNREPKWLGREGAAGDPTREKRGERLFFLLERGDFGWKLAGVAQAAPMGALYLDGTLALGEDWTAFPASADAAAHVAGLLDRTSADPDGAKVRAEAPADAAVGNARAVPGSARHVVELTGADGRAVYVLLDRDEGGFRVRNVSLSRSLTALMEGLPVGYDLDATEGAPMADDKKVNVKLDSPEAKAAMAMALSEALKQLSSSTDKMEGAEKKNAEALFGLFQKVLTTVPQAEAAASEAKPAAAPAPEAPKADGPVVDLAEERAKRGIKEPSPLEQKVQGALRDAVNGYMADHVVSADMNVNSEIPVDAEFVKAHGPALFTEVLQAFAKSLIPDEIKIDLPVPAAKSEGDAPAPAENAPAADAPAAEGGPKVVPPKPSVKLKVDFNDIVNGVLSSIAQKSKQRRDEGNKPE